MSTYLKRITGNAYRFDDGTIAAEMDILGSEEGFLVVLKSIKPLGSENNVQQDAVSLAQRIIESIGDGKRNGEITVLYNGKILLSKPADTQTR